ncbi:hypothetical protein NADFUDRAFT_45719 [Nadsonia fulvescens var. elongata DSM 6958]|uniref:Uncharacterized protein n=1 Tax=Nadsonia fulvescens var. elongata DSM 6958 TaxID=857566 RepID=A0A1E3PRU3_9ASCO|nr:hypothetical protein NADFUDRAFT_45719 [Nadsonia fulvescens var. elongata DSM 6958]
MDYAIVFNINYLSLGRLTSHILDKRQVLDNIYCKTYNHVNFYYLFSSLASSLSLDQAQLPAHLHTTTSLYNIADTRVHSGVLAALIQDSRYLERQKQGLLCAEPAALPSHSTAR